MISATYLDHMGDDNSVVTAARVSFAKEASNYTEEQNHRLINFLARERHELPFAHTAITLRCSAPVPIRTQCFKSKVGFVENEESRRYITSRPQLYVPDFWRTKPEGSIKQGSGTGKIDIKSEFNSGFCIKCGEELILLGKGGQPKKYCGTECKTKFTNANRNPYKTVFQNCEARVKREGKRKFELDFDTFDFPEYCKYLGIRLDYSVGKGKICDNSPSFDRIDASKDYTPGNVEIISNKANTMKSSADKDELVRFAKSVLRIHGGYIDYGRTYEDVCSRMIDLYEEMIEAGVSPEQARFILPQGIMVNWIWTGSLLAYSRFCKLRLKPDAQAEVRVMAEQVSDIMAGLYPVSWKALEDAR